MALIGTYLGIALSVVLSIKKAFYDDKSQKREDLSSIMSPKVLSFVTTISWLKQSTDVSRHIAYLTDLDSMEISEAKVLIQWRDLQIEVAMQLKLTITMLEYAQSTLKLNHRDALIVRLREITNNGSLSSTRHV